MSEYLKTVKEEQKKFFQHWKLCQVLKISLKNKMKNVLGSKKSLKAWMDEKYDKFSARHREKRAKGRVEEWMRGKNSFVGEFSEIKQILSINVLSDIYTKAPTELQLLARVKEREHKEHSEWKFQWRIIACSDCNLFIPQATSLCKLMQKVNFRCNILWLSRERKN